jgi:hypothetical protein
MLRERPALPRGLWSLRGKNLDMGYKVSGTTCVVRLVPLAVNRDQAKQCEALRREAGRCWSDMVAAHVASRSGHWLSADIVPGSGVETGGAAPARAGARVDNKATVCFPRSG